MRKEITTQHGALGIQVPFFLPLQAVYQTRLPSPAWLLSPPEMLSGSQHLPDLAGAQAKEGS